MKKKSYLISCETIAEAEVAIRNLQMMGYKNIEDDPKGKKTFRTFWDGNNNYIIAVLISEFEMKMLMANKKILVKFAAH